MFAELAPLEAAAREFFYDPQAFRSAPFLLHARSSAVFRVPLMMGSSSANDIY
ncbi:MAG: hypothetical protein ABSH50_29930 [Bryobacteraceae bacterium]